jgi:hypothetical protein
VLDFQDPFGALMRLTEVTGAGTTLIITTANADSLAHVVFITCVAVRR